MGRPRSLEDQVRILSLAIGQEMHFHFDFNHYSNTNLFLYQQLEALRLEKAALEVRHKAMTDSYMRDLQRWEKKKTSGGECKNQIIF